MQGDTEKTREQLAREGQERIQAYFSSEIHKKDQAKTARAERAAGRRALWALKKERRFAFKSGTQPKNLPRCLKAGDLATAPDGRYVAVVGSEMKGVVQHIDIVWMDGKEAKRSRVKATLEYKRVKGNKNIISAEDLIQSCREAGMVLP